MWEKNQKIIDIVDKKIFQPELRRGKEKPRLVERKKICLKRNLVKIRYYAVLQQSWTANGQLLYRLPGAPRTNKTDLRLPAGFWL